jgi:murein L,D-transpeptidase YafK
MLSTALLLVTCAAQCSQRAELQVALTSDNHVRIVLSLPRSWRVRRIELVRSTSDLDSIGSDTLGYPVTTLVVPGRARNFVDSLVADGVEYQYQARITVSSGPSRLTDKALVAIPARALVALARPSLLIDKPNFLLEVRDGEEAKKRFPIALGRNPVKRKLCQDNASTPEGYYYIAFRRPKAHFYRAYDLDYPNREDYRRYDSARMAGAIPSNKDIGGAIQIHGCGIESNWTFGCIALRDEDIDELMAHHEIGIGTPVLIVGRDVTRADLSSRTHE